ncbi:DUF1570 domain-containing protein [Lignipirellula cremea]|uniref:DUF1570 domain-containing protein n=1 Tax=Lignipirellula cremea TaxID=2528010 RepID=A0A518E2Q8_9BACT|nr:DUF1570 domain-containing protein [Lignipirellula cremea]QDU98376.1 hypothetical protein Pla8534_62440 [Lignipirellula cremea]
MSRMQFLLLFLSLSCCLAPSWASADEQVRLKRAGVEQAIAGQILVEASDGGLLLEDPDGVLWVLQPGEIVERKTRDTPFARSTQDELAARLLAELGDGFQVHTTAHFVICYETSPAYAQWCGALYERLYRAFLSYWEHRDVVLTEAPAPLPAIIFKDKASYVEYASAEFGEAAAATIGYYSIRSNRVLMYDLTGADAQQFGRSTQAAHINAILTRRGAERTVATIVHEATHQIAFNCGLHTRYADIPLWVSEGVAMYFETPDLGSSRGWRTIGAVNRTRLLEFKQALRDRPAGRLAELIADDALFRNTASAAAAYPEAWALNYYLLKRMPKEYAGYLKKLSERKPVDYATPDERLADFKEFFGEDLAQLEVEYLRAMRALR